jgi:hypothetical protein
MNRRLVGALVEGSKHHNALDDDLPQQTGESEHHAASAIVSRADLSAATIPNDTDQRFLMPTAKFLWNVIRSRATSAATVQHSLQATYEA